MMRMMVPRIPALPIAPVIACLGNISVRSLLLTWSVAHGTAMAALLASSEMDTAQSKEQMVQTGAKKDKMKANPFGHPVRLSHPAKVK